MNTQSHPSPSFLKHKWTFRVLAIVLGLVPFLLMEGICLLAGWGEVDIAYDSFVGFSAIQPLFEKNKTGDAYIIAPARRDFFAHDEFPAKKSKGDFRIFCLGGSTVQGRPYSIETSFTKWLEISLQQMQAEVNWDVINCGGLSYASYRLVPILEECLDYEPDLFIICTGHNEFLEERQYSAIKKSSPTLQYVASWGQHIRMVNVVRSWIKEKPVRPQLDVEVQARLDFKNGLERFHRDPELADSVAQHFESNLQRMVALAKRANVPILFVKPCSNLAGTRPFKSEVNPELSDEQNLIIQELFKFKMKEPQEDLSLIRNSYAKVCELDPSFANAWYELGQCELLLKNYEASRTAFVNARDTDLCPLRMTTPLEVALEEVVIRNKIPMLDAHRLLEEKTETGILGNFWLVDHVHPSFSSHQEIALALAKQLVKMNIVTPQGDWERNSKTAFTEHFESLPRTYFHKGQRMLERLQGWTKGEAELEQ